MKGYTIKGHKGPICQVCYHSLSWNMVTKTYECLNKECSNFDKGFRL